MITGVTAPGLSSAKSRFNVPDQPASLGSDTAMQYAIVAEWNDDKPVSGVHTVAFGVIPASKMPAEISSQAQQRANDQHLGCGYHK